jgi:AraC-like DNA-binding protein
MLLKHGFDLSSPKHTRVSNVHVASDLHILEVGYNKVPPLKQQIMQRDLCILHYCVNGKGIFQDKSFEKGYVYVTVPGELEIISADAEDPYETYWITFKGSAAQDMLKLCGIPLKCSVFPFDKTDKCAEILRNVLYNSSDDSNISEACSLLSAFYSIMSLHMESLRVSVTNNRNTAKDVANFLSKNYQSDIKIDSIADMFNYSRNHLYALFKKEYGVSPKEYLLNLRIEKAKQFLTDESIDFSIKEISYAVGFHDPFYFSKLFSNRVGISPLQYQKKYNTNENIES